MVASLLPEIRKARESQRGFVTRKIELLRPGRVRFQGYSWRAVMPESVYQAPLLSGQPVIVTDRQHLTLTVLPIQSLLWEDYLSQSWQLLDRAALELLHQYDGVLQ